MKTKISLVIIALLILASTAAVAEEGPDLSFRGRFEQGFLWVVDHRIQLDQDGTYIDYVDEGGQDVLFPFSRFSLDMQIGAHNILTFLYQPLEIATTALSTRTIVVNDLTFPAGTVIDYLYSFPFYRASWMYDFADDPNEEIAFGLSLQIRNARIEFESIDSTLFRSERNVGPVPILKARVRRPVAGPFWAELEADGFYAPISYLNGSDNDVIGAILDAGLRGGVDLGRGADAFLTLRYLGGGSVGTDDDHEGPGDGYARNWLHFVTVSAGFSLSFLQ
jgi:hypothetical protein